MQLLKTGCEVNKMTKDFKCALSEAVRVGNEDLTENLLRVGAYMFHKDPKLVDHSAFF